METFFRLLVASQVPYYLPFLALSFALYEGICVLKDISSRTSPPSGYTLNSRANYEAGVTGFQDSVKKKRRFKT